MRAKLYIASKATAALWLSNFFENASGKGDERSGVVRSTGAPREAASTPPQSTTARVPIRSESAPQKSEPMPMKSRAPSPMDVTRTPAPTMIPP